MSQIPEDFRWDCLISTLKCELHHLINSLMPLSLDQIELLQNRMQVFPAVLSENISYKMRLDLEKKLEHLPIKLFWCPNSKFNLYHYQNAISFLHVETPFLPMRKLNQQLNDIFQKEVQQYQSLYTISDFSTDFVLRDNLLGLNKTCEEQSIFNKQELSILINILKNKWNILFESILRESVILYEHQISFISQGQSLRFQRLDQINLTYTEELTEDLHLLLPDSFSRALYCKVTQSDRSKLEEHLNPSIFQNDIFEMSSYVFLLLNQWAKIKEFSDIFYLNHSICINETTGKTLVLQNSSSATGFFITFKVETKGLPIHTFSNIITTEAVDLLLATEK